MFQWAWSYITFDRGARLIIQPLERPLGEPSRAGADRGEGPAR
jgi:hypothetical protein